MTPINWTSAAMRLRDMIPGVVDHFERQNRRPLHFRGERLSSGARQRHHHLPLRLYFHRAPLMDSKLALVAVVKQSRLRRRRHPARSHSHRQLMHTGRPSSSLQAFHVLQRTPRHRQRPLTVQLTKITELKVCRMINFCTSSTRYST